VNDKVSEGKVVAVLRFRVASADALHYTSPKIEILAKTMAHIDRSFPWCRRKNMISKRQKLQTRYCFDFVTVDKIGENTDPNRIVMSLRQSTSFKFLICTELKRAVK
jgi:hypothetical protein